MKLKSGSEDRALNNLYGAVLIGLLVILSGCVPIPIAPFIFYGLPLGQMREKQLEAIKVGTTTKKEVIETLGDPSILKTERFFIYQGENRRGYIIVGYAETDLGGKVYRLLMEFDEEDVVKKYKIEKGKLTVRLGADQYILPERDSSVRSILHPRTTLVEYSRFFRLRKDFFSSVAFSPDGTMVAATPLWEFTKISGKGGLLWELERGKTLVEFKGKPNAHGVAFTPDGKTLIAKGLDGYAAGLIDLETEKVATGKCRVSLANGTSTCWAHIVGYAVSPDGKMIAGLDQERTLKVWDLATGVEKVAFKGPKALRYSRFSPDGKMLVTVGSKLDTYGYIVGPGDLSVQLWDLTTGAELASLKRENSNPWAATFAPDGSKLAINFGSHVELWRLAAKDQLPGIKISDDGPESVFVLPWRPGLVGRGDNGQFGGAGLAFSPDGRQLLAISGPVVIWDLSSEEELVRVWAPGREPLKSLIFAAAFSPDGKSLATADSSGVNLWNMERRRRMAELLSRAREGDPDAQFDLADQSPDLTERWQWICLAAHNGHARAQHWMAARYHAGAPKPVKRDDVRAYIWYSLAASNGNQQAERDQLSLAEQLRPEQLTAATRLIDTWTSKPGECTPEASERAE